MKYLSLFSGIGGFELGIQQAYDSLLNRYETSEKKQTTDPGIQRDNVHARSELLQRTPTCIGFSEIDKYATQIYQKHFLTHKPYGDITKLDPATLPNFDLICGGFPCQSFSIAGKRGGFEDTRGTLFFDIARIIRVKRPRFLFLENVKGLLSHDAGNTFATIIRTIDELGYDCQWQVLNSKNFGVPQNRERVFIIGHLRGTPRPQIFPIRQNSEADIILPTLTARYYGGKANGGYIGHKSKQIEQLNQPVHSNDRIYGSEGIAPTLNTAQGGNRQPKIVRQPLRFLERNQKNVDGDHSFTVDTTNTGGVRVDNKIRRLTPTECERLQGFPDSWTKDVSDSQRYKCLGNAVTVNVIQAVIEKLFSSLKE